MGRLARFADGKGWPYLLLAPSFILVAAVVLYPIVSGVLLSFQDVHLNRPRLSKGFVGIQNYLDLLSDPTAQRAVLNTLIWVGVGVVGACTVGMITALPLSRSFRGVWIARLIVLLPFFMPTVVVSHMWQLMLDYRIGVINDLLVATGILPAYQAWFAEPTTALLTALAVQIWQLYPFFTVFLLAGILSIPRELHEAAEVDGAGGRMRFRYITLPLLKPIIVATSVLAAISLANNPDLLIILTRGGPANTTQVLSLYAFQRALIGFDFGYAAAIGVVLMGMLAVFAVVTVRRTAALKQS